MATVEVFRRGNKVVLVGKVSEVFEGTSQKGTNYVRLVLGQRHWDPDMEMDIEESVTVIFTDNENGKFGPAMNATNVSKLKIRTGATIANKATVSENDDGTVSYFGIRAQYCGCIYKFKPTDDFPSTNVIVGVAVVKANNNVSVPVNAYDNKTHESKTIWLNTKAAEQAEVVNGTFDLTDNKKNPIVAFVVPKITETEKDGMTNWAGDFIDCRRIS